MVVFSRTKTDRLVHLCQTMVNRKRPRFPLNTLLAWYERRCPIHILASDKPELGLGTRLPCTILPSYVQMLLIF